MRVCTPFLFAWLKYLSACSDVFSSPGVAEWYLGTSGCDSEGGREVHPLIGLQSLGPGSFAHVAVNVPEVYVKPTAFKEGS